MSCDYADSSSSDVIINIIIPMGLLLRWRCFLYCDDADSYSYDNDSSVIIITESLILHSTYALRSSSFLQSETKDAQHYDVLLNIMSTPMLKIIMNAAL